MSSDFVKLEISLAKPVASAAVMWALSTYYFQDPPGTTLPMAAATGMGIYLGSIAGNYVPDLTMGFFPNGKSIERRLFEIAGGSAVGYAINKYYLNNDLNRQDMLMRLGAIAAADIISEYFSDYMEGKPLSIFE